MQLRTSILSLALAATSLLPHTVLGASGDWPQWRGPNRENVSPEMGLLKQWPAGGPPLLWKATGLGGGYSSVSVADERVFTLGDGPDSSFIIALDARTGKKLWSGKLGQPGGGGGYPGPRCTPTVESNLVFALGQQGDLICVETATGREVWRKHLAREFGGSVGGWQYSESPLVDEFRLICTPGGSQGALLALHKKTGAVLWRTKELTDSAEYSSPIVAELVGKRQHVQMTGEHVVGVDPATGKLLWRVARRGRTATIPTPVAHEDRVYVTSGYGVGCHLFKIALAGGGWNATEVYANKNMVNHHGGVVRVGDYLYGYSDGKGWVCQHFKTGNLIWSERRLGKGSLTCADGHLYLRTETGPGTVALIEASPSGYQERGRFDPPDRSDKNSWPHPVVAGGRLYLRDQEVLLCFNVKNEAKGVEPLKR